MTKKSFKGGVHPHDEKQHTEHKSIESMPLPAQVIIPLQQHIGAPAEAIVNKVDAVVAGQVIGYVGDSGNAEGTVPHTHSEIKHDSDKKNPYDYLTEALARSTPARPTGR